MPSGRDAGVDIFSCIAEPSDFQTVVPETMRGLGTLRVGARVAERVIVLTTRNLVGRGTKLEFDENGLTPIAVLTRSFTIDQDRNNYLYWRVDCESRKLRRSSKDVGFGSSEA